MARRNDPSLQKLARFAVVMVGATAILVALARQGSGAWYLLAAPIGLIAMIATFVSSAHWVMDGGPVARPAFFYVGWLSATAIFVLLGQRGTAAWYLLAVPSGLFSAVAVFLGLAVKTRDPKAQAATRARRDAEQRAAGWWPCPGCKQLRPPPVDPTRCHGCGKRIDHKAQMCVCGDCYAAHLQSN